MIHAAWNSLSLAVAVPTLLESGGSLQGMELFTRISSLAPYFLAALTVAGLLALLALNRAVRAAEPVHNSSSQVAPVEANDSPTLVE
jgi:hypothetical protein